MRKRFVFATVTGLLIGLAVSQLSLSGPAQSQESAVTKKSDKDAELEGLKASSAAFEKAFNAKDSKAIGAQFIENAEAIDDDGNILEGRAAIEERFAELFKASPKAHIAVEVTSVRRLGPEVAIENGFSTTKLDPDQAASRSPYTVVHVKRNGKWLIASVQDFPEEVVEPTAHDQLKVLEWLVGHWVDESPDGRVETTCKWSEDGNFLLQEYAVKSRWGGMMRGTQRIAWDGLRRTIRSWAFDQSGAFTEAFWREVDGEWIVRAEGVTSDGQSVSVTRVITRSENDTFQINSTNLVVGYERLPDNTVRVVRQPPTPAQ